MSKGYNSCYHSKVGMDDIFTWRKEQHPCTNIVLEICILSRAIVWWPWCPVPTGFGWQETDPWSLQGYCWDVCEDRTAINFSWWKTDESDGGEVWSLDLNISRLNNCVVRIEYRISMGSEESSFLREAVFVCHWEGRLYRWLGSGISDRGYG